MSSTIRCCLVLAACLLLPVAAAGQIISTMVPLPESTAPGGGAARPATWHVMAGFTNWDFGFDDAGKEMISASGGSVRGGENGFLFAGDFAFAIGRRLSVGVGGWYNTVSDLVINEPDRPDGPAYELTGTRSFASVYGNVFYGAIGVQAGVVPVGGDTTIVVPSLGEGSAPSSQTDMDVFAVGRFGSGAARPRWSAMVGAGLYRYGARPAVPLFTRPPSPAASAFSAFANASIFVLPRLSVDASIWYTGKDANYSPSGRIGNPSQTRLTIGVGFGL